MYPAERQQAIVDKINQVGRVSVTTLAKAFDVTSETIRRDLDCLDKAGAIARVHGGALSVDAVRLSEPTLSAREMTFPREKLRIAEAAQDYIPDNPHASLLLDAGTTTAALARMLTPGQVRTVVTNSVPIASEIATRNAAEVQLIGGRVRGLTQATVGANTVQALTRLRVDVCFIGTNGFSLDHGLSTPDASEAAVKTAMCASANWVVALADGSKFDVDHLVSFANWDDIDVLITDSSLNPRAQRTLAEIGIEVVVA